ncbi:MAG: NAD(P)/FAD-dependent oxidoreductase [Chitinophagaceae bacterium]|jgi:predicted Rossmann fold flavoprotein|nr:NAD(P)/FAD-dependent oxidoreductase [Chitinophagaceae bacterium]
MKQQRLIVIGGGAAGFFCAVNAARIDPQLQVTILEKTDKLLSKVKVSGGGRCNTTHDCMEVPELIKKYPRGNYFVKKTFYQFAVTETVEWFKERGVSLHTEADGRMFPTTNSSQTIINCLLKETDKYGVAIKTKVEAKSIEKKDQQFVISTTKGEAYVADFICIATGGYPKEYMFDWIKAIGHTIVPPVPSLFTFNMPGHAITKLMGVSVPHAMIKITGSKLKQEGPVLITHWGLSGPAILKLSAWGARELADKQYQFSIIINWLGDTNEQALREHWTDYRTSYSTQKMYGKNPFALPNRLWEYFLGMAGIDEATKWAELKSAQQQRLIQLLVAHPFDIKGKTTFKEEFVTCGGISLQEIDPQTMMSKKMNNLFFAGEVTDVDGVTGGFNFQHAWTSGWIAARAIAGIT